jgi:hypothetical protein
MSAIEPKIMTWARETTGLSLDDAAGALGLTGLKPWNLARTSQHVPFC